MRWHLGYTYSDKRTYLEKKGHTYLFGQQEISPLKASFGLCSLKWWLDQPRKHFVQFLLLARLRRPAATITKTFTQTYPSQARYMQSFIKIHGAVLEKSAIKIMTLCNFNKDEYNMHTKMHQHCCRVVSTQYFLRKIGTT